MTRPTRGKTDVVKLAWPLPFTVVGLDPGRVVPPSLKVTVPWVTAAFVSVRMTVAVKVTLCPLIDGFGDEVMVVEVGTASVPVVTSSVQPLSEPDRRLRRR